MYKEKKMVANWCLWEGLAINTICLNVIYALCAIIIQFLLTTSEMMLRIIEIPVLLVIEKRKNLNLCLRHGLKADIKKSHNANVVALR